MIKVEKIKENTLKDQVRQAIFAYIQELSQARTTKLPSEDDLATMFGVSRITIRGALNELQTQGYVFRRHGKGTFINAEALKMKAQFNPVRQFSDIIRCCGYTPSVKIIALRQTPATATLAQTLQVAEGETLVEARKVFYASQRPACLCVDYFPLGIFASDQDLADYHHYEQSIFDFIAAKTGRTIVWDSIEISALTNHDHAELTQYFACGTDIRAFLFCQGINYDEDDRPLLYACEYIDTELIKYHMIRQKSIE